MELSLNVLIYKCNLVFYGFGLSIWLLYDYGGYKGFFVDCIYIYSVIGWLCRWVKVIIISYFYCYRYIFCIKKSNNFIIF